jgi:signal peptidase
VKKTAVISFLTLVVLFMLVAATVYIGPHLGLHIDNVVSGSMEPALKTGSLVVSCPVDPETVEVDDIITFFSWISGNRVVHRVIQIDTQPGLQFTTKGDANLVADPSLVRAGDVLGRVCLYIPGLGGFVEFLDSTIGFIFGLMVPGAIIVVFFGWYLWNSISGK